SEQFTPFLFQMIPAIQLLDVDVLLPKSLRDILKPKPSVKLKKAEGKSYLRLDQLLDFDWQVSIGDAVMDEAEFKRLLKKSDGLIKYKSQYMYVDKVELEKLFNHFNTKKVMSSFELLRVALSGEYAGAKVSLTDEVKNLIKELTEFKDIPLPKSLKAELRPYQSRGYSWMYRNAQIGFGSVIADDMGLGKTLQVITTLLKYKEDGFFNDKKALVVVPTGLLSNWEVETQKFAPTLRTHIFHGTNRKMDADFDVMLTTYGIVRSEAANLKKHKWQTLIIDEAQNIKNSATAQSKAIKSIGADHFIAMSGTPVENRLSELWSILDFSNRGILGNAKDFHEKFGSPIEIFNDVAAAEKLKKVTAPFLMRRLKSDKSIISDLPDKIEMDCFATLTKVQASLYEKTLEEAMNQIDGIDSSDKKGLFVRQGLVLQMILALKQICNHPTQFLKNNILDASLSGKLDLLFDKLDSIVDSNEKVLLFTQFKEMGTLLQHFITQRYKESPLFYHGGCSVEQRKEMVNSFQMNHADKIFILSLKAAGTGLNLTAANHVIHYDLWWNPAVEAQATDRAYRIGQKSNIMVHRFISKNTFEERINDMIQSKKNLAELTVNTGENWIGNMSNKEIKQLFELG
ncbi:MAG: DEAD/DEAH box helicase, partial [Bacteroidetes bacterium]|nr:DEAD/DEAH box helicase [Bacteroidota bacterium]